MEPLLVSDHASGTMPSNHANESLYLINLTRITNQLRKPMSFVRSFDRSIFDTTRRVMAVRTPKQSCQRMQ